MKDNSNMGDPTERPTKSMSSLNIKYLKIKRIILGHVIAVRIFLVLAFILIAFLLTSLFIKEAKKLNASMYLNVVYNFIQAPIDQLASSNGRTNILIMGKAGGAHDGPDLTDTMMLFSISLKENNIKIISIPRDTWIPETRSKINSAYYWGGQNTPYFQNDLGNLSSSNRGINFAKVIVSGVVGVPIQYGALIDFSGFKDIIDEIGGITVDVPNSFTDYFYPIAGRENDTCGGHDPLFMCRYETLHFDQGKQLMNGELALKFVRSRHAEGVEGTDIAREARQQKVIEAVKNKLMDKNTYVNFGRDVAILKTILGSVQTDLDYPTAAIIARKAYDSRSSISSFLIPEGMLVNPLISSKYDMQSVLIPKAGSGKWEEINNWVASVLK
jgi:LCP family protein required for cell wall assembly